MKRIRSVGDSEVAFTVRGDDHGGKRMVRLDGSEFVRRFLLHILLTGIKRIRHYGVLASACKGVKLALARLALQMPAVNPRAIESAKAFMARVARINVLMVPGLQTRSFAHYSGARGPRAIASTRCTVLPQSRGPPWGFV